MKPFLRCSLRQLLVLVLAIGVLLAIVGPWLRRGVTQRRAQIATENLLRAASAGDSQAVAQALANGADVGIWDNNHTPLSYAIRDGNLPLVNILLEAGADPNLALPGRPLMPLEYAAQLNNAAIASRLLEVNAQGPEAMQVCVEGGCEETLKLLLANPRLSAKTEDSRLVIVAIESSLPRPQKRSMVRLLLEHRAALSDTRGPAARGLEEPLDRAVRNADMELCELLIQFGATYSIREAVALNRLEDVQQMVQENPRLLHNRLRPYFAAAGEDPTVLGTALRFGHHELAVFLVDAGAPLDALEWPGATMMHQAAIGGDAESIRLLEGKGLAVNALDRYGYTPLLEAAWRGHTAAVAALIELGADVNLPGTNQTTPLHAAASKNNVAIALLLIAAGADASLVDRHGKSPHAVAVMQGSEDVAGLLKQPVVPE